MAPPPEPSALLPAASRVLSGLLVLLIIPAVWRAIAEDLIPRDPLLIAILLVCLPVWISLFGSVAVFGRAPHWFVRWLAPRDK